MLRYHQGYIRFCDPERLTVRTDHSSLSWLLNFNFTNALYRRWIVEIQAYGKFNVVVRKGTAHQNADAVSRIATRDCRFELCPDCSSIFRDRYYKLRDSESSDSDGDDDESPDPGPVKFKLGTRTVGTQVKSKVVEVNVAVAAPDCADIRADGAVAVTTRQQAQNPKPGDASPVEPAQELRRSQRVADRVRRDAATRDSAGTDSSPTPEPERTGETNESDACKEVGDNVDESTSDSKRTERRDFDPLGHKDTRDRIVGGKMPDEVARGTAGSAPGGTLGDTATPVIRRNMMSQVLPRYSVDEWIAQQQSDPVLCRVMVLMERADDLSMSDGLQVRRYYAELKNLFFNRRGVLCRKSPMRLTGQGGVPEIVVQRVVPEIWHVEIFRRVHQIECIHMGYARVYQQIWKRFFWVTMVADIRDWLRSCDNCQHYKVGINREAREPVQDPMGEPLDRVAMDLAELPITPRGNKYLLVVQDYFSKYIELFALPTKESRPIAELLHDQYFTRYGVPLKLYSDKGREFDNALMAEFCEMWKIKRQTTCGYNPAANGMVERSNRTVKNLISQYDLNTSLDITDWDLKLSAVRGAFNNTVHSVTGYTPHRLMFSQCADARTPTDLFYDSAESARCPDVKCYSEWLTAKRKFCQEASAHAQSKMWEAMQGQLRVKTLRRREFKEGQLVLRYYGPHASKKLHPCPYDGPWKVISVCNKTNTVVLFVRTKPGRWIHQTVTMRNIKPYITPPE